MPVYTVEQEGRIGHRCICADCGQYGDFSNSVSDAVQGFYPIDTDNAFAVSPEDALYYCALCHLGQLVSPDPFSASTQELQDRIVTHIRRVAPDVSLAPGSLMRGLVEVILHSYRISNAQLSDRIHGILQDSPENRERSRGIIEQFLAQNRDDKGKPPRLPKPVPAWCVERALVRAKSNGRTFRVVEINATRVRLSGDEDIEFSRYESFDRLFEPYLASSFWERLEED
jgi:hypothetical protein